MDIDMIKTAKKPSSKVRPSTKQKTKKRLSEKERKIKEDNLFKNNMHIFKLVYQDLAQKFLDYKPLSKLIYRKNGEYDIEFKAFNMYPEGATTHAKKQLAAEGQHLYKLGINTPTAEGLDKHSKIMIDPLLDEYDSSNFRFSTSPIRDSAYFVLVFGFGLGEHIMELVERSQCRVLLIAEPNHDLLYHSMKVFDWVKLFKHFADFGQIELFTGNLPKDMGLYVQSIFRRHNPSGLDGTILFKHYANSVFTEAERYLNEHLRTALMGLGFFQDDINMIAQTYKNLEDGNARLIRKLEKNDPQIPAFIIGSGPSLTELLPFIKENQDKAVIFACGTSIDNLLNYGITPDFYAIAERGEDILIQARETSELYNVKNTYFIGSTSIFPGVSKLFKDAIFFFRPGLSCTPLFADSEQIALIPDPLAANAGLSVALHLGFRDFYLCGVDMGSEYKTHGHAPGGWYDRHDVDPYKNFSLPARGNFGGAIWTMAELEWSRQSMETLISASPARNYSNLGTGALIKGATPRHQKTINLPDPKQQKKEIINHIIESCNRLTVEEFDKKWQATAIIDNLFDFSKQLKDATKIEPDPNGFLFAKRTNEILKPIESENALAMLLRGTIFTTLIINNFYSNRLMDPAEREPLMRVFKEHYCQMIDRLRDRAVEIFLGVENGESWNQFVE